MSFAKLTSENVGVRKRT